MWLCYIQGGYMFYGYVLVSYDRYQPAANQHVIIFIFKMHVSFKYNFFITFVLGFITGTSNRAITQDLT